MAVIGFAAGLLHTAIFEAISPMYRHDPAATVNVAGMLFGLGCLTVALLVSGIYYIYTPAAIQVWIAVIPALAGWGYWKTRFAPVAGAQSACPARDPGRAKKSRRRFAQPDFVFPIRQ